MQPTTQSPIPISQQPNATPPVPAQPAVQQQALSQKLESINYKALELIDSAKGLFVGKEKHRIGVIITIIAGIGVMVAGVFNLGLFIMICGIMYVLALVGMRNKKLWVQFALDNGWSIGPASQAEHYVPPSLQGLGHSRRLSDVIQGTFNDNSFRIFTYSYTVGSGKHSHTYTYTIMQLLLPKQLPLFFLDSKKAGMGTHVPAGYEKVSLEGNFDSIFTLHIPAGTATDVLSVISPDVMQTLMTVNATQDIESAGGYVWFMQYGEKRKLATLPGLFKATDILGDELGHRLKSYKATNPIAHAVALTTAPNGNMLFEGNLALLQKNANSSNVFRAVIIIFVFVAIGFSALLLLILAAASKQ